MTTYVLIGPPAAGKSWFAESHAEPGDVIVDLDRLALAMQNHGFHHNYPRHIRDYAIHLRDRLIDLCHANSGAHDTYLIHALPSIAQIRRYRARRYVLLVIDPGETIVRERAALERPSAVQYLIDQWYDHTRRYCPDPIALEDWQP